MFVHLPNERPSTPQGNHCLLSHFLASLGAREKTDCTTMLWSVDCCQNRVSANQYHLTVSRAQVSTHQGRVFLKLSADKLLVFEWSQAQVYFFNSYEICCVTVMSQWPRTIKILISNWPRTRKFGQLSKNTGGEDFFLPWSHVGHALRPILLLWLVKIGQVSSCGKFLQHLETCFLWQLKLTVFCVNLWCF